VPIAPARRRRGRSGQQHADRQHRHGQLAGQDRPARGLGDEDRLPHQVAALVADQHRREGRDHDHVEGRREVGRADEGDAGDAERRRDRPHRFVHDPGLVGEGAAEVREQHPCDDQHQRRQQPPPEERQDVRAPLPHQLEDLGLDDAQERSHDGLPSPRTRRR
jgi:hypothetical protein